MTPERLAEIENDLERVGSTWPGDIARELLTALREAQLLLDLKMSDERIDHDQIDTLQRRVNEWQDTFGQSAEVAVDRWVELKQQMEVSRQHEELSVAGTRASVQLKCEYDLALRTLIDTMRFVLPDTALGAGTRLGDAIQKAEATLRGVDDK